MSRDHRIPTAAYGIGVAASHKDRTASKGGNGGAARAFSAGQAAAYLDNSGKTAILPGPTGPLPTTLGASYPANTGGVPNGYLALYPDRTDPETIIAAGPWAGMMVAEHVGAWLTSPHYAA